MSTLDAWSFVIPIEGLIEAASYHAEMFKRFPGQIKHQRLSRLYMDTVAEIHHGRRERAVDAAARPRLTRTQPAR